MADVLLLKLRKFNSRKQFIHLLIALVFVASCSAIPTLTQTPTLYLEKDYPADAIPPALQTTQPKLYFMTDRFLADEWTDEKPYSSERSPSMAFGEVTVAYGKGSDWDGLVLSSNTDERPKEIPLKIVDADELIRFPSTPLEFSVVDDQIKPVDNPAYRVYKKREKEFKNMLSSLLVQANKKEVVLLIHGFKNDFDDAAYAMADVWHFSGRIGVPIFFTWPAGAKGVFGYLKDRESGEYSIYHLKETLRLIAATPGLEKVHIIAHSRGADVATTALRELIIETRAKGQSARKKYKIQNLILAAPDLDFGVVRQRLLAEKFSPAFGQVSVYVNKKDDALGLAQRIMSGERFGRLEIGNLENIDRKIFAQTNNVNFMNVESHGSSGGHSYFRQNPNVLSDIALTLQTSAKPGTIDRPLLPIAENFWRLTKYYPYDLPPEDDSNIDRVDR